jgi:hypothetical protein
MCGSDMKHRRRREMRIVRLFALVAIIAAAFFILGSGNTVALAEGTGALVVKGEPCGLQAPSGDFIRDTGSHAVVTPSGEAILSCHGELADGSPAGKTFTLEDFPCAIFENLATESHLVVTKSGQVLLFCHVHSGGAGDGMF